ncbi:hypothetical protein IV203_030183 [Nitzschia inconspicua]|uniref:Uncharacterized protein n=1 Tax=Nitzschia inconspicua TaxID=303405 RepID=A0A9K3Q124_9STRA|nr:hypothetical protein IV203_030183 [Nitzschia inconspicua]
MQAWRINLSSLQKSMSTSSYAVNFLELRTEVRVIPFITHKSCSKNGIESRALIGSCDSGIGNILNESLKKCTIGNEFIPTTLSLGGKGDTSSGKTSGECALLSNTRSWKTNGNDESGVLSFSSDGTTMGESAPSSTAGIAILLNTVSCKGDTAGNRGLCSVEHPDECSPNNEKNSVCGNGGFMSFRVSSENGNRCFASNTTSPFARWVENHRWWIIAVIIFIPVIMYFG